MIGQNKYAVAISYWWHKLNTWKSLYHGIVILTFLGTKLLSSYNLHRKINEAMMIKKKKIYQYFSAEYYMQMHKLFYLSCD